MKTFCALLINNAGSILVHRLDTFMNRITGIPKLSIEISNTVLGGTA